MTSIFLYDQWLKLEIYHKIRWILIIGHTLESPYIKNNIYKFFVLKLFLCYLFDKTLLRL